jgi:hypothetical protein
VAVRHNAYPIYLKSVIFLSVSINTVRQNILWKSVHNLANMHCSATVKAIGKYCGMRLEPLLIALFTNTGAAFNFLRRKLRKEKLHNLYNSATIFRMIKSRRMRWVRHITRMGKRNVYRLLMEKPQRKRPLARPRRR